jgi:hypothetical protein
MEITNRVLPHVCVFLNGQELCTLETQISIPLGLEDP